jgi:hypothetical protein
MSLVTAAIPNRPATSSVASGLTLESTQK